MIKERKNPIKASIHLDFFRGKSSEDRVPIEEIVSSLPMPPDEICRQGEKQKYRTSKYYEEDSISYIIRDIECSYLEEEIDDLLKRTVAVAGAFHHFERSQLRIACYADGQTNPEIIMSPEVVSKMASLNGRIWIDIYCT